MSCCNDALCWKPKSIKKMDFESCYSAAQFAIPQSQNSFVIPNATPLFEFGLNMLATGHVGPTVRNFDVTQPLSLAVFNRVDCNVNWKMAWNSVFYFSDINFLTWITSAPKSRPSDHFLWRDVVNFYRIIEFIPKLPLLLQFWSNKPL